MIEFLSRAFGGGKSEKPKAGKHINLALQGGGALGAFTWGVLDHLLEDSLNAEKDSVTLRMEDLEFSNTLAEDLSGTLYLDVDG